MDEPTNESLTNDQMYLNLAEIFTLSSAERISAGFGWLINHERIAQKLEAKAAEIRAIGVDPKWVEWRTKKAQEHEDEKIKLSKNENFQ